MRDQGRAFRTRVGKAIQQLRLQRGWSQEQLAERANGSAKTVGRVERGEVGVGIDGLYALARALSASLADLVAEPHGRRSSRAIHLLVLTDEELAHLEGLGGLGRRIKSARARHAARPPK